MSYTGKGGDVTGCGSHWRQLGWARDRRRWTQGFVGSPAVGFSSTTVVGKRPAASGDGGAHRRGRGKGASVTDLIEAKLGELHGTSVKAMRVSFWPEEGYGDGSVAGPW